MKNQARYVSGAKLLEQKMKEQNMEKLTRVQLLYSTNKKHSAVLQK